MATKEYLKRYYFYRLFLKDKLLFGIIILFFMGVVIANLAKLEETPFFVWYMYNKKAPSQESYSLLEIRYGGDRVLNIPHTWAQPQNMLLHDPLSLYIAQRVNIARHPQSGYPESHWMIKHRQSYPLLSQLMPRGADFDAFPAWFKSYLAKVMGEPTGSVKVVGKNVRLTADGFTRELSADTLLVIP